MSSSFENILNKNDSLLKIYTLGKFEIYKNDLLISGSSHRSVRMWNLFKYIMTYKDKLLSPSELIDNLWQDEDCINPEKALQNLVYRLRNTLTLGDSGNLSENQYILFIQGCYKWNSDIDFWLDSSYIRELYSSAKENVNTNSELVVKNLETVLSLYQGPYLNDLSYELWVIPARNQLQNIYVESATILIEIYIKEREYEKILKICETVTKNEPYEEKIHVYYLDALVELHRKKQALSHYEYITALMFKDLGIKPSLAMKEVYKKIKSGEENLNMNLSMIQKILSESNSSEGAFFCDIDTFHSIYKLESRRMSRSGLSIILALLSVTGEDLGIPEINKLNSAMAAVKDLLITTLRKSDVISQWDKNQYVLILTSLTMEDSEMVLSKVIKLIKNRVNDRSLEISYKVYPIEES